MIGVLRLTDAQRKLLEQRNVIAVDIGEWGSVCGDHAMAISTFFKHLQVHKPIRSIDWPSQSGLFLGSAGPRTAEELIRIWSEQRASYPNWVVAPEGARERLRFELRLNRYGLAQLSHAISEFGYFSAVRSHK